MCPSVSPSAILSPFLWGAWSDSVPSILVWDLPGPVPVRVWLGSSWVGVGLEGTCASVLGRLSVIDFWNIFRELAGEYPWQGLIHIGVGTLTPPCRSWQLDSSAQESLLPGRFPRFRGGPVLLLQCHSDRFPHLRGGQSLPYMPPSNRFPYSRGGCGLPFVAHSRRFPHFWGGEVLTWFPSTGR